MIHYFSIVEKSRVDGPGSRSVIYLQGCSIGCKGCQSKHLWPKVNPAAKSAGPAELAMMLVDMTPTRLITIQGGEPFDQAEGLGALLVHLALYDCHVIVYSGYTLEYLQNEHPDRELIANYLGLIDILVDGPFMLELDNPFIAWRGSTNQRPIDIQATIRKRELVVLDWNAPRLIIPADGSGILAPVGIANQLKSVGTLHKTRRCGQSK